MAIDFYDAGPPATELQVAQAERALGLRMPEDFREFLKTVTGGGYADMSCLPGDGDVGLNMVLGVSTDRLIDIVAVGRREVELGERGLFPVAECEGGNFICLSLRDDDYGTVWFADHELDYGVDPRALRRIGDSWSTFVAALRPPPPLPPYED